MAVDKNLMGQIFKGITGLTAAGILFGIIMVSWVAPQTVPGKTVLFFASGLLILALGGLVKFIRKKSG